MSVVIVGGNDKMIRQYEDLCKNYKCKAKVFTQPSSNLREKIELDPKHPQYLKVVWGVGYKIEKQQ